MDDDTQNLLTDLDAFRTHIALTGPEHEAAQELTNLIETCPTSWAERATAEKTQTMGFPLTDVMVSTFIISPTDQYCLL